MYCSTCILMASSDPAAKRDKLDAEAMAMRRRAQTLLFGDSPTGAERLAFNAVFLSRSACSIWPT
jgi:hypothetical protein